MSGDATTNQVNQRVADGLAGASWWLPEAVREVTYAIWQLEAVSEVTSAHDEALEELRAITTRINEAEEDLMRRWRAETRGER